MKAVLLLDPDRREEQLAFIRERAQILRTLGDQLFVSMPDEKAGLFAQQGIHVQPQEAADLIQLPAVVFDPGAAVPSPPSQLTATPPSGDDTAYYIVQFVASPEGDWIRQIRYLGGSLIADVPIHAAVFRLSSSQANDVKGLGDFVRWVGLFHPAYAMSFEVAGKEEPFSASDLAGIAPAADKVASQPEGSLMISFFSDRSVDEMRPLIEAAGAQVVDTRGSSLIINAPADRIPAVLRAPGVHSLEVFRPPQLANQRAGIILGANQVRNFGNVDFLVNLDGSGEVVGVFDTGLDSGGPAPPLPPGTPVPITHTDFFNSSVVPPVSRVMSIDNLNILAAPAPAHPATVADFDGHGTHVCGSIVGNGQNAPLPDPANPNRSVPRGIAPAAQVALTSVNNFNAPPPPPPLPLSFSRFMTAFQNHYNLGARVHSNSWGSTGPNAYTNATSGIIDRFAFLNPDTLILFAGGNDEADLNNDGIFDQNFLGDEVTAKNILTIGASENVTSLDGDGRNYQTRTFPCNRYGTLAGSAIQAAANLATPFSCSDNAGDIAMFSSRGRVQNALKPAHRRVKPDLVAPGTNILSTRSSVMPISATILQRCPPIANPPGIPNPRLANTAPAAQYFIISGTSMATPLSSGACLLVRQFYRSRFGQLRRPLLLEQETAFVDLPCASANNNGPVLAWIHRDGAGQNNLVTAQYAADLSRTTNIVQIAANVGAHPAAAMVGIGANTCFLYRDSGSGLHLLLRDAALAPVAAFGTAGAVTLSPLSRPEDDRRPAMAVNNNEIAVVWVQTGSDNLMFQRFRADTGAAIDASAQIIGLATHTSPHPYLLHNGAKWAVFWGHSSGANFQLLLRFIDNAGKPAAVQPITVVSQAQDLREPHAVWDGRQNKYMVAYVSAAAAPNRGIRTQRLDADGTPSGAAVTAIRRDTANVRRPRLSVHPDSGFFLIWEDNSQDGFDVYFALLDPAGAGPASPVRISDTPKDSNGFSAMFDNSGFVPVWQSNDEINSNLLGTYALRVLKSGLFEAQADPATPLLVNQTYVPEILSEHVNANLTATAIAWGGGEFYLARLVPDGIVGDALELAHTDADGRPLAVGGTVRVASFLSLNQLALSCRGDRVLVGISWLTGIELHLLDLRGQHVPAFGAGGKLSVDNSASPPAPDIFVQVAQSGSGAAARFFALFGAGAPTRKIRYAVLNATGGTTGPGAVAPRDLVSALGTAKHGWFQLVLTDAPPHFIAAWHIVAGANTVAQLNKFLLSGNSQAGIAAPIPVTGRAGDAQNPVIAPRPVTFAPQMPPTPADIANQSRREFGAAWQHRDPGGNWQVLFSRLQQNGRPSITAGQFDVVVVQSVTDHAVEPQLVWHTDGYGLAWLQQPTAGGNQQLFFTILDQNGVRPNLAAAGAPASPAANFALSAAAAEVKTFHLIWTGRSFRIAWTEVEGGGLRHKVGALAVPRAAGGVRYDAPFQQPSSALVRATLINGATNIRNTALPNFGNNVNDGYGWGRINLRQSLSPSPPVTFFVRDDGVVGQGQVVTYNFPLPPNTQFLRITLVWTDPPDNNIVNHLHLRVTTPAFNPGGVRVFHGNQWQAAAGSTHLSAPVVAPIPPFEDTHTVQQVVISGPPELPAGNYKVEVIAGAFGGSVFQQFPGQPFALVFVGSGPEIRTSAAGVAGPVGFY